MFLRHLKTSSSGDPSSPQRTTQWLALDQDQEIQRVKDQLLIYDTLYVLINIYLLSDQEDKKRSKTIKKKQ